MIAARNALLMGGSSTPTARDYVQDGLVAMWDGIENAGWNQHDASATTWTDLVGGVVAQLTRGHGGSSRNPDMQWGDNALIYPSTLSCAEFNLASLGDSATIEVAYSDFQKISLYFALFDTFDDQLNFFKSSGDLGDNLRCAVYGVRTGVIAGSSSILSANGESGSVAMFFSPGVAGLQSGALRVTSAIVAYNPAAKKWGIGGPYSSNFWTGKIHSFRLYSRALTAAEVAANCAIDAARFGL